MAAVAVAAAAVMTLTYGPSNYYVTVTGSGNPLDVRMLSMPITVASQQVDTVVLTPASGGQLLNGSFLVQQGAYSAFRNTNTRVRLASAVSGSLTVAASASSTTGTAITIDNGSVAPAFSSYTLVPQGSSLNVNINGTPAAAPSTALVPGGDMTLLVYGTPTGAASTLLTDDNRPPTDPTTVKLRLINGISGNTANALTFTANTATVASSVLPNTASSYTAVASSLNAMNLSLYSSQSAGVYYSSSSTVLNANSVYTVLATGPFTAPLLLIR